MSENCTHDCSTCSEKCSKADMQVKQNEFSSIKKVIGIVSGKGGVGKSLVSSLLGVSAVRKAKDVAILDADITGPSIPKIFGVKEKVNSKDGKYLIPAITKNGIKMISINLLLEEDTDPVVWRGPVIGGVVKQFFTDVLWGDVDYMFVDMPPGTGDVPLTVFQSLPVDGIIIVTSPQDLVSMIVGKAVKMANLMGIPVLGIVENMSYLECPTCKEKINVFGESKVSAVANEYGIKNVAKLPINPQVATLCDSGKIEDISPEFVSNLNSILSACGIE